MAVSRCSLVEENRRLKRQADLCARDQGQEVEEARRWQVEAQRLAGLLEAQDKLEQGRVSRVEQELRAELRRMVEQERARHEPVVLRAQASAEELAAALEEFRRKTEAKEGLESSAYEVWKTEQTYSWVEAERARTARERAVSVRSAEDEAELQRATVRSEECELELAEKQNICAMAEGKVSAAVSRATAAEEALSSVRQELAAAQDFLAARLAEVDAERSEALAEAESLRRALRDLNDVQIAKEEKRAAEEEAARRRSVSFAEKEAPPQEPASPAGRAAQFARWSSSDRSAEQSPALEDLRGMVDQALAEMEASELRMQELEGELAEGRSATGGAKQEAEALQVQLEIKVAVHEEAAVETEAELKRLRALDFTGEIDALQSRLATAEAEMDSGRQRAVVERPRSEAVPRA